MPPGFLDTLSQAKIDAVKAIPMLTGELIDPTSFTLLHVHVVLKPSKDPNKPPSFYGCINYVAGNRMGGKEQAWSKYGIDKKGQLTVNLGTTDKFFCTFSGNEISVDVTADVKKVIANTPD